MLALLASFKSIPTEASRQCLQRELSELKMSVVTPGDIAPPGTEQPLTLEASEGRLGAGNQTLRLVSYSSHSLPP